MSSPTSPNRAMDSLSVQFEGISISDIPNTATSPNTSRQMSSNAQGTASRTPGTGVDTPAAPTPGTGADAPASPMPSHATMPPSNVEKSLSSSKYADADPPQTPSRSLSARGPGSWAYRRGVDIPGKKHVESFTQSSIRSGASTSGPPPTSGRASILPGTNVFEPGPSPFTQPFYYWPYADYLQANMMAAVPSSMNEQALGAQSQMPSSGSGTAMYQSGYGTYAPLAMAGYNPALTVHQASAGRVPITQSSANSEQVRTWMQYLASLENSAAQSPNKKVIDNTDKRTGPSEPASSAPILHDRTNRDLKEVGPSSPQPATLSGVQPAVSAKSLVTTPAPKTTEPPTSSSIVWTPKHPAKQATTAASPAKATSSQGLTQSSPAKPVQVQDSRVATPAKSAATGHSSLQPPTTPTGPKASVPTGSQASIPTGPKTSTPASKPIEKATSGPATSVASRPLGTVTPMAGSSSKSAQGTSTSQFAQEPRRSESQPQRSAANCYSQKATVAAANNQGSPGMSHEEQMRLARELQASFSRSGGKSRGGRKHAQAANQWASSSRFGAGSSSAQPSGSAAKISHSGTGSRPVSSLNPAGTGLHGSSTARGPAMTALGPASSRFSGTGSGNNPAPIASQQNKTSGGSVLASRNAPTVQSTSSAPVRNLEKAPAQAPLDEPLDSSITESIAKLAKEFRENMGLGDAGDGPDAKAKLAEAGFLEKWPEAPVRRGPDPNQRRVTISGFTDRGSPALVFSIVWGGMVELVEFEYGSPTADVVFLRHRDCMEYYEVTASKIRIRDEEYTVKLADKLDPPHPDYDKWAAARATRCVRATPVPRAAYSLKKLLLMGKVYNLENLQAGADWCLWIFMGIEGSYNFRASLVDKPGFEGITITFAPDPCAEAVGVHAE